MFRKSMVITVSFLAAVSLIAGCSKPTTTTPPTGQTQSAPSAPAPQPAKVDPIKVGIIYPMTGDLASVGTDARAAMELAAEIINGEFSLPLPFAKTKGIPNKNNAPIQLIFGDSQGKPELARSEAERLINEQKVVALMGAWSSSTTAPASQVAERYGVPYVTPESTRFDLTERGFKWFFRNIPYDKMAVEYQFKFLDDLQKTKGVNLGNIGIAYENSLWGQGSAEEQHKFAKQYGWKIAVDIAYPKEITDVTSEVLKLKAANIDTLLMTSYVNDSILFQKAFKEHDFNPKIIVGLEGGHVAKEYIPSLGSAAEYVFTSATWSPSLIQSKPLVKQVNDIFREKHGKDLSAYQPHEFSAVFVMADALNRAKSLKPDDLLQAIKETDYPGDGLIMPWKGVKYNEKGQNIYGYLVFLQIQNGKYEIVYPFDLKTKDLIYPQKKWSERK